MRQVAFLGRKKEAKRVGIVRGREHMAPARPLLTPKPPRDVETKSPEVQGEMISLVTEYERLVLRRKELQNERGDLTNQLDRGELTAIEFRKQLMAKIQEAAHVLENLRETAAKIYRSAVKSHLIRGRSIEGIAAAALYCACRMLKIPRTLQEIADAARVDKKEIGRSYRFVVFRLNLSSNPTKPIDYISRFISELSLSNNVQKKATEIVRLAD